jgi:methylmalonyl-CoA mutase
LDDKIISLAAEFAAPSRAEWLAIVEKTLKGAPFEKRLVSKTYGGQSLQPLYTAADGIENPVRALPSDHLRPWDLRTAIAHPDPVAANAEALKDLEGGAASILLTLDPSAKAGIAVGDEAGLAKVLNHVLLDLAPVALDAGFMGPKAADWLGSLAKGAPQARLAFHMDPLGALARQGTSPGPIDSHLISAATVGTRLAKAYPKASLMLASGQAVHEAGGAEAQELAVMIAAAAAYAKALNRAGMDLNEAFKRIVLGVSIDGEYFINIAKLRAARLLFAKLTAACGCEQTAVIEARSSHRMLTRFDPWVNLLRLTAAGFSAATGGADSVILAPFTDAIGLATTFARRQARNIQLVLMEESHLGRVADPAGGAWFVESLTNDLARDAWSRFQAIEAAGGLSAALTSASLAQEIAATRKARESSVAKRKDGLIGVSEFPNPLESPVEVLHPNRAGLAVTGPEVRLPGPNTQAVTLPAYRAAAALESLRDRAATLSKTPKIFLATLGEIADFSGRVGFASNLFAITGAEIIVGEVGAFGTSGAKVAVLCSSDDLYASDGAQAAKALKAAGASRLYLAGRPGDLEQGLTDTGVDSFVFAGMDVLGGLGEVLTHLGAA